MKNNNEESEEKPIQPNKVTVEFQSVNDALFFLHTLGFLMANQETKFLPDVTQDFDVYTRVKQIGEFLKSLSNGIYDALEAGAIRWNEQQKEGGQENA